MHQQEKREFSERMLEAHREKSARVTRLLDLKENVSEPCVRVTHLEQLLPKGYLRN